MLRQNLPPAANRWTGFPRYNFVGGHNDPETIPVEELIVSAERMLHDHGRKLATYHMDDGPQGFLQLRELVCRHVRRNRGITCEPDQVLITSGSVQGLHLVNSLLLEPGDTVVAEEFSFNHMLNMVRARGAEIVAAPMDELGMSINGLEQVLDKLHDQGVVPKYIYTIPTVQNPTGSILPEDRRRSLVALAQRHGVPVFEDDCYADLTWTDDRPPAIRALGSDDSTIYIGSFSKSLAPALRLGYLIADWPVMSRLLPLKLDGGTSAVEQMLVADYFGRLFDNHIATVRVHLKAKLDGFLEIVAREFGASVDWHAPEGGIFLWLRFPDSVDTAALLAASAPEGVVFDTGSDWAVEPSRGRHHLRLCFANIGEDDMREGVAKLAEICRRETGTPERSGNIDYATD